MAPVFRSPRLVLSVVAVIQMLHGVALICFNHEFFKLLAVPRPEVLLPFQIWGAISVTFGVTLLSAAKQPLRYRALCGLIATSKFAAGGLCLGLTVVQGLEAGFAFTACLLELAPASAIATVLASLPSLGAARAVERPQAFWRRLRYPLAASAFVLFILLGVGSNPVFEYLRTHDWLAPVALADSSHKPFKARLTNRDWSPLPSQFPITPGAGLDYRLAPALGALKFTDPVSMIEMPGGTGRWLIAERPGKVVLLGGNLGWQKKLFLDLRPVLHYGPYSPEEGLLSVVLHPGYADASSPGFQSLFVFYTRVSPEGKVSNCVSRFQVRPDGEAVDADSEKILFCQAYTVAVHHGGGLAFGPDGFLYVGVGDGFWGAPNEHAQRIDGGFFSGILRVDVDQRGGDISHPIRRPPQNGFSSHYFVPNDNPFLSEQGEHLEEFFAIGFRNPWRLSFDRQSGELWVADSGFEKREEINRVAKGDNGGWAYLEGSVPTRSYNAQHYPRPERPRGREIAPVHEYPRTTSYCTVGGFVYRGKRLPSLQGKFVFGDVSGQIWALTLDESGQCVKKTAIGCVPQPLMALCSLAEDAEGELYLLATKEIAKEEGSIYRIEAGPVEATAALPRRLSETGLFDDLARLTPHSALTPYEINVPFWSDHAVKSRFVGTQSKLPIRGEPCYPFKIPTGTIFVKHFDFPNDLRQPQSTRRLETRVLVFTLDQNWYGLSYRWNSEGTDAELLNDEAQATFPVTQLDGSVREQTWTFPDRHACLSCHNGASEGALGFSYRQLWREGLSGGASGEPLNQLERLRDRGVLAAEVLACDLNAVPRLASHDDSARSLEERARSYLDANCAYCHRNGVWYSTFDLRYDTPLNQSQIFSEPLLKHFTDATHGKPVSYANPAMAIAPGEPEESFLLRRMNSTEEGRRMPPIGRAVVDERGVDLVREWILSMKQPNQQSSQQRSPASTTESAAKGSIPAQEKIKK